MNRIFNRLLNVKNTVVEDACIVDSPLRPGPVLEVHVRPRAGACSDAPAAEGGAAGMTRAAACGVVVASVPWAEPGSRSTRDFGTRVADERREPEDRKRFSARRVARRRKTPPIGSPNG